MSQETIFEKVRFRNFQSFGNNWTELPLEQRGTTLIIGENLDEGGSSGAGKTTAMSVVSYCLYDKIPSGVSKDRMINRTNDKKNTSMEAQLYFRKGTEQYMIHRRRGAETGVQLFHNGKDITPASVGNVNEAVEQLIGFSYNLFSQIVLFNGNSRPFLDLSVGDQRNLIEELFKITMLSKKANALKKQAAETTKAIDLMKVLIKQQELQNEGFWKRVREADERASRWYVTHDAEIASLESTLTAIESVDFDTEEQLHARITELESIISAQDNELKVLAARSIALGKERSPHEAELTIANSDVAKKKRDLIKVEGELTHLRDAKCPYCLQSFEDAKLKIDDLESAQMVIKNEIDDLTVKIERLTLDVVMFTENTKDDLQVVNNAIATIKDTVKSAQDEINDLKSVLSYKTIKDHVTAQAAITSMREKLDKLKTEVNPHTDAITELAKEGEIPIDREQLDELINLQAHQAFMVKLLTDKNSYVRKNLISTTTPFLNKRIGYYIEKLNLPHVVLFQPDMSCEISQLGRSLDHGNLSNGEKKRLNLAICLSFRDVLTYLHSKVNVLFTDEVDGGSLDQNCIDLLIGLLKHKAWDDNISIYIISHSPVFDGRCDRNIVVRKEQGFSSLILQPDA